MEGTVSRKCEMCDKTEAKHKCIECDQLACENCIRIHATIKTTRFHMVVNFDSFTSGVPSLSAVIKDRFCREHLSETLRFYCTQCSAAICRDCKLTAHDHHTTTDLSKMATRTKSMLLSFTKETNDVLRPMLEKVVNEAEAYKRTVSPRIQQIQEKLKERADEIMKEVHKCLDDALKHLTEENSIESKAVSDSVEEMKQQLAGLQSLCQHVELVTRIGCDADILELHSQVADFFGIQRTVNMTPHKWMYGNQIPQLSNYTSENWRHDTEFFLSENNLTLPQTQGTLFSNVNHGQQSVARSALSAHIKNYIGKLERTKITAVQKNPDTPQMQGNRGVVSSSQNAPPGQQIRQEIMKIQQFLINWKNLSGAMPF